VRVAAQPAFVLHARPWRETSVMVELLTRDHGRVGVVARGLTTAKRHPLRAALQPLQAIRVDYEQRGELARLVQAEAVDAAPQLQGERLMAAFYANELLLKLTPRNDAAPALFELYARVRDELAGDAGLAWLLRRFERDLLEALGVGLPWDRVADGESVLARGRYRIDPELGPLPETRRLEQSVSGEALLALVEDREPSATALAELRLAMREVLQAQLGAGSLRSWGMLDELARLKRRR
jgi:DNA repair protein RecO (recombination protein O)